MYDNIPVLRVSINRQTYTKQWIQPPFPYRARFEVELDAMEHEWGVEQRDGPPRILEVIGDGRFRRFRR